MALLQQIMIDHDIGTIEDATISLEMLAKEYLEQDGMLVVSFVNSISNGERLFHYCHKATPSASL
jgi:hypothetical protein